MTMFYELREYETALGTTKQYADRFTETAMPIMRECGFDFVGTWITEIGSNALTTFVWMLRWPTLDDRTRAFGTLLTSQDFLAFAGGNTGSVVKVTNRILKGVGPSED